MERQQKQEHKRQQKLARKQQQKLELKQQPKVQLPQQRRKAQPQPQPQQSASQPKDKRLQQSQLNKKMFDEMEKFRRQPVIEQQQIQLLSQRRRSPERLASSICQVQPGAASPEVKKPKQKRAPLQRAHSAAPQHQPEVKKLVSKRVYVSRNSAFVDNCGYFRCDVCNKRVCHSSMSKNSQRALSRGIHRATTT